MTEPRVVHVHLHLDLPAGTPVALTITGNDVVLGAPAQHGPPVEGQHVIIDPAAADAPADEGGLAADAIACSSRASRSTWRVVAGLRELGYTFIPQHSRLPEHDRLGHTGRLSRPANYVRLRHPDGYVVGSLSPTYVKITHADSVARVRGLPGAMATGRKAVFATLDGAGPALAAAALLAGQTITDEWVAGLRRAS
jgi:hypothetical protein